MWQIASSQSLGTVSSAKHGVAGKQGKVSPNHCTWAEDECSGKRKDFYFPSCKNATYRNNFGENDHKKIHLMLKSQEKQKETK